MNFCSRCGAALESKVPAGDDRPRYVCPACGTVHYENPKLVVGTVPEHEGRILLCRRAIEPRYGKWTLPAGYLEKGESVAEGALRETREEAGAEVCDLEPYALFNLTFVAQIYLMFRARLANAAFSAGDESLEVELFEEAQVPWGEIAFTVIEKTLRLYFEDRSAGRFTLHMGDIVAPPRDSAR